MQGSAQNDTQRVKRERSLGRAVPWEWLARASPRSSMFRCPCEVRRPREEVPGDVERSVNDVIQLCQAVNELSAVSLLCIIYWNTFLTHNVSGLPDTYYTKIMIL